jgi:hypothetical protein
MCLMSSNPKSLVTIKSGKKASTVTTYQNQCRLISVDTECCRQVASKTANVNLLLSAQLVFFLFSHKQKNVQQ